MYYSISISSKKVDHFWWRIIVLHCWTPVFLKILSQNPQNPHRCHITCKEIIWKYPKMLVNKFSASTGIALWARRPPHFMFICRKSHNFILLEEYLNGSQCFSASWSAVSHFKSTKSKNFVSKAMKNLSMALCCCGSIQNIHWQGHKLLRSHEHHTWIFCRSTWDYSAFWWSLVCGALIWRFGHADCWKPKHQLAKPTHVTLWWFGLPEE